MPLEKSRGSAQQGVVEVVTQIGDHAETCVVHQVGTGVIKNTLEHGGADQGKRHDGPRVLEMRRYQVLQVNGVLGAGVGKQGEPLGLRSGVQDAVENGADKQNAERVQQSD